MKSKRKRNNYMLELGTEFKKDHKKKNIIEAQQRKTCYLFYNNWNNKN